VYKKNYRPRFLLPAVFASVLFIAAASGCDEKSFGPQPDDRQMEQGQGLLPPPPDEPTLAVGDLNMPMPVPSGFKRIPAEHPLMRAAQTGLGNEETILCIFERQGENPSAETGMEGLLRRDLLQVSTLNKWMNASISNTDFSRLKQPWQEESIVFNRNTLTFFEDAAMNRLNGQPSFSYNMGMIDSGPLHISFLKILKYTLPGDKVIYICRTNSALWRYGKILNITYNRPIDSFHQIQTVVAESVGYLQKLQSFGRTPEPAGS
ncbi:MAG: hypothetical protein LBD82_03390, partial [Deltaproteobacteria bacterium]|nr:hypothetical protein [Deltaproteobacteria bacterium]